MSKKAWISASIILLGVLFISFYNQYKKKVEQNNYRYVFASHLHGEINNCVFLLSRISSNDEKVQQNAFKALIHQLEVVDRVIRDGHYFMDRNINYSFPHEFYSIGNIMDGGFSRNGHKICDGFLEDGKLSEKEIAFLTSLKEDLERIQKKLYSGANNQANYKLSIKGINEMLAPFCDKYDTGKLNLSN